MMLGDILAEAHRAAALLDPTLLQAITAAGQAPAGFARAAVVAFEREATEEDWATLVSAIRKAELPGTACLETMVRWQLRRLQTNSAVHAVHEDEPR